MVSVDVKHHVYLLTTIMLQLAVMESTLLLNRLRKLTVTAGLNQLGFRHLSSVTESLYHQRRAKRRQS